MHKGFNGIAEVKTKTTIHSSFQAWVYQSTTKSHSSSSSLIISLLSTMHSNNEIITLTKSFTKSWATRKSTSRESALPTKILHNYIMQWSHGHVRDGFDKYKYSYLHSSSGISSSHPFSCICLVRYTLASLSCSFLKPCI